MINNNQSYKKLPLEKMEVKNKWKSFPCTNKNLAVKKTLSESNNKNYWDTDERDCQNDDKHKNNFYDYDIRREENWENYPDNNEENYDDDEKYFYDDDIVKEDNNIDNDILDYDDNDDSELNVNVIDSQIYKKSLYS